MNMKELEDRIIRHEGMVRSVYNDHLGNPTIGVGHLITPEDNFKRGEIYGEEQLKDIFRKDLKRSIEGANRILKDCSHVSNRAREIIVEMVFQLGEAGTKKFKKAIAALQANPCQYKECAKQMLDSRWAKQTPNRAQELSKLMGSIDNQCG